MAPDGHFDEPRGGAAPGQPSIQFSSRRQVMRDAGIPPFAAMLLRSSVSPTWPSAVSTLAQVAAAMSVARRPALNDK
jgi:hypothetical protein